MQIVASTFSGSGQPGDFRWMIEQPEFASALFVFNDNEEQFRAYQADPLSGFGCRPGGGNAVIRPYRCADPVRAAGVPTGSNRRGYPQLTNEVRVVIDDAVAIIRELQRRSNYDRLFYSADASGRLGTGIFTVGEDVKRYIVAQLVSLNG